MLHNVHIYSPLLSLLVTYLCYLPLQKFSNNVQILGNSLKTNTYIVATTVAYSCSSQVALEQKHVQKALD